MGESARGDWERDAPGKRAGFIAAKRRVGRSEVGYVAFEGRTQGNKS